MYITPQILSCGSMHFIWFTAYVIVTVNTNKKRKPRISKMDRLRKVGIYIVNYITSSKIYHNIGISECSFNFIRSGQKRCIIY